MRQHIVPRFYLEAFCDPAEPSLWQCDMEKGIVKRKAPRRAALRANYYSVVKPDGDANHQAEELLSKIESAAAPVIERLRAGSFKLTDEEREQLALFMGFFIVRVPAIRDFLEKTAGKVMEVYVRTAARRPEFFERMLRRVPEIGDTLTPDEIEKLRRDALEPEKHFVIRGTPDFSLGQALGQAMTCTREIWKMRWEILVAGGKEHFITGDMAVTWRNPRVRPPLGAGLGMRGTELSFPISPQLCLIGVWRDGPNVTDVADDRVQDFNRERVRHAQRFLFTDDQAAGEWALGVYADLRARDEAHVKPFSFVILTEDGPVVIR